MLHQANEANEEFRLAARAARAESGGRIFFAMGVGLGGGKGCHIDNPMFIG
jgi:hypothetical protein